MACFDFLYDMSVCVNFNSCMKELVDVVVPSSDFFILSINERYKSNISSRDIQNALIRGYYRAKRKSIDKDDCENLASLVVSEGLSRSFVYELIGSYESTSIVCSNSEISDYAEGLKKYIFEKNHRYMSLYSKDIDISKYTYERFGVNSVSFVGYCFSTALAASWLEKTEKTALQSINTPYKEIIDSWISGEIAVKNPIKRKPRQPVSRVLSNS